jgi:hypothetical protein
MDTPEAKRPCLWREKKMLRRNLLCSIAAQEEYTLAATGNTFVFSDNFRQICAGFHINHILYSQITFSD